MKYINNDTVFITGASSGIGKELAKQFAQRGYNLALVARRAELLAELKSSLSQYQVDIQFWSADVTDEGAVKSCIQQATSHFGTLDIIIANAGLANSGFVGEQAFSEMKAMIDVNLTSSMMTAHYGLQQLRRQQSGQMVFISSVVGARGMPGVAAYSASKSGITTFAEALRAETYKESIDITILCPGYINTPIGDDMDKRPFVISAEKAGRILAEKIENKVKRAFVPAWPWAVLARIVPFLPTRMLIKNR